MRRPSLLVAVLLLLAGCSSSASTPTTTTEPALPVGKCSPTPENPALGLAAITDTALVRVWLDPTSSEPLELARIGDDPFAEDFGGDLTVVESAAVSIKDCKVFVGACCEPVSGITFHGGEETGEWGMLMGRLPTISPDGGRLALVSYEQLVVSSVDAPEETEAVIPIPTPETVNYLDARWINIDQVALFGATPEGVKLWIVTVGDQTVSEPMTVTDTIDWMSPELSKVGLVGIDDNGNIALRRPGADGAVVDYRYPSSFEVRTSTPLRAEVFSYRIDLARSAMVTDTGALSVWVGNGNPVQLGGGYVWAG